VAAVQTAFDFASVAPGQRDGAGSSPRTDADPGRRLMALGRLLSRQLDMPVSLTLTDNARTMVSLKRRDGIARIRLHHLFAEADTGTQESLSHYLERGDRAAAERLRAFIERHRDRIRPTTYRAPAPRARGHQHDLGAIFEALNDRYFASSLRARVGWSRMGQPPGERTRRRSIKLGSYRMRDALIRIHPALDAAWVPRFFVEYVVYHEMLHHALGVPRVAGRRRAHNREFRAAEARFERYEEALAWERAHLDRLLRA